MGSRRAEAVSYEIGVILGMTIKPQTTVVYSIWPSWTIFNNEYRGWNGEWNMGCERWFQDCLAKKKLLGQHVNGRDGYTKFMWKVFPGKSSRSHLLLGMQH